MRSHEIEPRFLSTTDRPLQTLKARNERQKAVQVKEISFLFPVGYFETGKAPTVQLCSRFANLELAIDSF